MTEEEYQELAGKLGITPEELREEVILVAYANARMTNPQITLEMVRRAAAEHDSTQRKFKET